MAHKKADKAEKPEEEAVAGLKEKSSAGMPAGVFKHAFERETGRYARKVQVTATGAVMINLPTEIASELQLKGRTSWKCERGRDSEGDYLATTPLKETAIPRMLQRSGSSLRITIPEEMLLAVGLKAGDCVEWREEEGQLSLRKAAGTGQYVTRLSKGHGNEAGVTIPVALARKFKLETGIFGVLRFDEEKLWLEPMHKNPAIMTIVDFRTEYQGVKWGRSEYQFFRADLPYDARDFFKKGDTAILEVKDGKLYMRARE
jgi:hypothetical protein